MNENQPFYVVSEIVYPGGIMEGRQPYIYDTHAYGDDIHVARALAFGLVAERMLLYRKAGYPLAGKSPALEKFEAAYGDDDSIEAGPIETSSENVPVGSNEQSTYFNETDLVFWRITLCKYDGDEMNLIHVYYSDDEPFDAIDQLLEEAIFLDEFSQVVAE